MIRVMLRLVRKSYYRLLLCQDEVFGKLAVQAMKWRGYSDHPIHPKHLFDEERNAEIQRAMRPGIAFLDIGAGVGSECIKACETGAVRSVGIERNPENIKKALARAKEKHVKVEILDVDLEAARFPLPDQAFDLVNFTNVLEHLNNRVAVLREVRRVKKADAPVLISVPNTDTTWKRKLRSVGLDSRDDGDHKVEYSQEELKSEIESAGLKITSPLLPVIPSFPWNGLFAFSAALSPSLYRRLQRWKKDYAKAHPEESIGWMFFAR